MPLKIGDYVAKGEPIATIQANDPQKLAQARDELLWAITWSDEPVARLPHFYGTIG